MRIVGAIVAAFLLAACQQPSSNPPSASSQSDLPDLGTNAFGAGNGEMRYFRPEGEALIKDLSGALVDACYGKLQVRDEIGFTKCLRERMTTAFDDSGQGRRACDHYGALDAYIDCLLVGNMVLDLRRQLDDDSPVPGDFWASKDSMSRAMIKSLMVGATVNCGTEPSETAILSCADRWLAKRLNIPDDLMKRCDTNNDGHEREACLGEAASLQYMRSHLDRIPKDTI